MEKKILTNEQLSKRFFRRLKDYRNSRKLIFFDEVDFKQTNLQIQINEDDVPIVLLKLKNSEQILITIRAFHHIKKSVVTKIEAKDLEECKYLPHENALELRQKSLFHKLKNKFELTFLIGTVRIQTKDNSFIDVYMARAKYLFVLGDMIRMLRDYSG
ncbi:hypothetical protein [Tenacibaculum jejuense]|uniref:Uncharacterized protein n=1 Tax=Tenacibaculum jejuense TaxID=584609 RepID=A0A238U9T7_9FLAO|nr:hypothetical protein [Tenacibaculum jejuense]SNR15947.1 protein of unknown function [Tenacibaculum jejuense]